MLRRRQCRQRGWAPVDPAADKDIIDTELQLKDLETIEGQLSKQEKIAATGNKDAKVLVEVLKLTKKFSTVARTHAP